MAEQIKIYRVSDPEFKPYGELVELPTADLITEAAKLEMPAEGATYQASIDSLEKIGETVAFKNEIYGELPIQTGCCWGHNNKLNALEWHKSSEINIAVTDFVLLLAKQNEMENGRLDSANVKAFLVKKGETVEVYATTLHFCPCASDPAGFCCIVILPKDTNIPLDKIPDDKLLFRKNKWLICHEENETLKNKGVYPGIYGINYVIE